MHLQSKLKSRADRFINALTREFGLSSTLNNGSLSMVIDGMMCQVISASGTLIIHTEIATKPTEEDPAYIDLLSLCWHKTNHIEESLSLDDTTQALHLSKKIILDSLSESDFLTQVEDFLNSADYFLQAAEKRNHYSNNIQKSSHIATSRIHASAVESA